MRYTIPIIPAFSVILLSCEITSAQQAGVLPGLEQDITALIEKAKPCVVSISAIITRSYETSEEGGFLGLWGERKSRRTITFRNVGSGLVLDQEGHIVTRTSVVPEAAEIWVSLADGGSYRGEFIGADYSSGLAVLRIQADGLPEARAGDLSEMKPGAWVTVIGNPLGMAPSVSFGLVEGIRMDGYLQLSTAVTAGNAGSPIFNTRGEVVGIVAANVDMPESGSQVAGGLYPPGCSLAYPISAVTSIAKRIIEWDSWGAGWLGITAQDSSCGPVVARVIDGGPAHHAGLRVGDVLVSYDSSEIERVEDIARAVKSTPPGQEVVIGLLRDDQPLELSVAIGERPSHPQDTVPADGGGFPLGQQDFAQAYPPQAETGDLELLETIRQLRRRINQLEREVSTLKRVGLER